MDHQVDPAVVAELGSRRSLDDIVSSLSGDRSLVEAVAARSYAHPNGFDRISLYRDPLGLEVRVHLWWTGVPSDESIHNHAWDFSSQVIVGSLRFQMLSPLPCGREYDRYSSSMPVGGRFGDYQFARTGAVRLDVVFDGTVTAGSSYSLNHEAYHRVLASPEGAPLVATIVVRGLVRRKFSNVLVPKGAAMPSHRSLRHLGGTEIVEKLQMLVRYIR
ncbi:hypothetical protein [Sphaerisporangium aureirubrum]|uniref:Cysteine dioxygenase n=1 Tax=Sphaerisporangium aureirubrum TaxID=1544736 RepID=A0ABW1NE91_9ACTN